MNISQILNFFKYDPETDGSLAFNIDLALNDNWDKILAIIAKVLMDWDDDITYAEGDLCKSSGKIYKSLVANNVGNAVTDTSKWEECTTEIVDNLTTDDATKALSAKQGKLLNEALSHENIGINCDFRKGCIVNQRGLQTYNIFIPGYTIDMWKAWKTDVVVTDAGIQFNCTSGETMGWFATYLETPKELLYGKVCTASIELSDGTILSQTGEISATLSSLYITDSAKGINFCISHRTEVTPNQLALFFTTKPTASSVISRVKLELGSQSTLALDPPVNYGEELAKCQRYLLPISYGMLYGVMSTATNAVLTLNIPTTMHTTPTIVGTPTVNVRCSDGSTNTATAFIVFSTKPSQILFNATLSVSKTVYTPVTGSLGNNLFLSVEP